MKKVYRTDKLTLFSYALLVFAYMWFFFLLVERTGGFSGKSIILVVLILPILAYFFFLLRKKIVVSDDGLEIVGITGKKFFKWNEIREISVSQGRKYFLFITGEGDKFAIIDDSVSGFTEIAKEITKRAPQGAMKEEVITAISSYKKSISSVLLILIASAVLIFLLIKSQGLIK
ncbi:PH domain-containing protein [Desulfurobacterium pacificum]|uniref:PH domain-containing protein n=1 Tax=Desulfurobacterium pacificum TaxID=240166 RepID=A0ABY1NU78_9BACT|nr:PH domain-containing protein [Desulfurobacterium pacificum]SMP18097.1 PH domain-containing protein [Desulfurobacterium pacificum]